MRNDQDTATGWVCHDCTFLLANGETPPEMNETETADWLARISDDDECTLGLPYEEHDCDDPEAGDCGCDVREFSWSRCDNCRSTLGGYRHAVTFWFDAEVTV